MNRRTNRGARIFAIAGLATLLGASSAMAGGASSHTFGLGVILGAPTGVSAKLWLGSNSAVDVGAAWGFGTHRHMPAMSLHMDYLQHFDVVHVSKGRLPLYVGIGGRVWFAEEPVVGLRIPLGITYLFAGAPLDLFFEIAPIMDLVPGTELEGSAAIGVRYYFD